jgi:hypothetical protein
MRFGLIAWSPLCHRLLEFIRPNRLHDLSCRVHLPQEKRSSQHPLRRRQLLPRRRHPMHCKRNDVKIVALSSQSALSQHLGSSHRQLSSQLLPSGRQGLLQPMRARLRVSWRNQASRLRNRLLFGRHQHVHGVSSGFVLPDDDQGSFGLSERDLLPSEIGGLCGVL